MVRLIYVVSDVEDTECRSVFLRFKDAKEYADEVAEGGTSQCVVIPAIIDEDEKIYSTDD